MLVAAVLVIVVTVICFNPFAKDPAAVCREIDETLALSESTTGLPTQIEESISRCQKALVSAKSIDDEVRQAKILNELGSLYVQLTKLELAVKSYKDAIAIADQPPKRTKGVPSLDRVRNTQQQISLIEKNLANVLAVQGNYLDSEKYLKSALKRNEEFLGLIDIRREVIASLIDVLNKEGKTTQADALELERDATELGDTNLMTQLKSVTADLDSNKADHVLTVKRIKPIALSAQRRNQPGRYVDAQTELAKTLCEMGKFELASDTFAAVHKKVVQMNYGAPETDIWLSRICFYEAVCCCAKHDRKSVGVLLSEAMRQDLEFFLMTVQDSLTTGWSRKQRPESYKLCIIEVCTEIPLQALIKSQSNPKRLRDLRILCNTLSIVCGQHGRKTEDAYYKRLVNEVDLKAMGAKAMKNIPHN